MLVKALRSPRVVDVTIVSRRRLFRVPPELDHMVYFPYEWCPRCRRPTMYELFEHHHAIPRGIPLDPDQARCVFCGIRRVEGYV